MEEIKQEDIHDLLEHFCRCLYKAAEADSKVRRNLIVGSTWLHFTYHVWKSVGCS